MTKAKAKKSGSGAGAFVLLVGDEGAILVQMQKKRVVRRLFAQSPEPAHTRNFQEALNSAPKLPLTMIVDMMDQSYVRQTLPPVSSFSVGKIVRRRLEKDFSRNDIKGYIILDREKSGRRDWNYLMVSLANPPLLQKWIAFASEQTNPFKGMGLTPLESQPFITAMAQAFLEKKGKDVKPLEWQILVSHHKVGGFRQVVLRNGKLVFTRLAQPIGESNPEVIAGNIEQELINTQEYLKRMGLTDTTTLSVVVVTSADIKKSLDPKNIKAGECQFLTPHEMSTLMGLEGAAMPEDHFGDVLICAFTGRRRKLILSLNTPYLSKLLRLSLYIKSARAAAALVALGIFGWIGMTAWDMLSVQSDTDDIVAQQHGLQARLEKIKIEAKTLPKQIETYTDIATLAKTFDRQSHDALLFVRSCAEALGDSGLVNTYHWSLSDPLGVKRDSDPRHIQADIDVQLTTPPQPREQFVASAQGLLTRMKQSFPQYELTHSELPGMQSDAKEFHAVIDENGNAAQAGENNGSTNTLKITLKGPQEQTGKEWPQKTIH